MSEDAEGDDEIVRLNFSQGDMLVMLARLANGLAQLNGAVAALARGDEVTAANGSAAVGEIVDAVMEAFREKLGADIVGGN